MASSKARKRKASGETPHQQSQSLEIQRLQQLLDDQNVLVANLQNDVVEKDRQLEEAKIQLKERDEVVTKLQDGVATRDELIKKKDKLLDEKDGQLKDKDGQLKDKDEQLEEQKRTISEKDDLILSMSNRLMELEGLKDGSVAKDDTRGEQVETITEELDVGKLTKLQKETSLVLLEDEKESKLVASSGKGRRVPHVPLDVHIWARILEYSTYDDVARMAGVSKVFLHEVMPLLKSLYFGPKDAQYLTEETARRFQNHHVEEIIIDCLLEFDDDDDDDFNMFRVNEWASEGGLVTFLVAMQKTVKTVFLGRGARESKPRILERIGLEERVRDKRTEHGQINAFEMDQVESFLDGEAPDKRIEYVPSRTFEMDQVKSFRDGKVGREARRFGRFFPQQIESMLYDAVVHSICDAYKNGRLPLTMNIFGLPSTHDLNGGCRWPSSDGPCELCEAVVDSFPLNQLLSLKQSGVHCYFPQRLGNSLDHKLGLLLERQDGREDIKTKQSEFFCDLLQQCEIVLCRYVGADEFFLAIKYEDHVLAAMQTLKDATGSVSKVVDANKVVTDACRRALKAFSECTFKDKPFSPYADHEPICILKPSFDALKSVGFKLDVQEFCVKDDRVEEDLYWIDIDDTFE